MESPETRIPVRSRKQAMDWSLVLLSQGIESALSRDEETGGWFLLVSAQHGQKAIRTLRQYHVENRGWNLRRNLTWPAVVFDWSCVVWALVLVAIHVIASARPAIREAGIMDAHAFAAGQWWRLVTATMLHADSVHLAENLAIGALLLGLALGRFGTGTGFLAVFLAGTAANLISLFVHGDSFRGLGASGVVMAALGLISAQTLEWVKHRHAPSKLAFGGIAAGIMLFVLYGASPQSDIAAHLGGFVLGLGLGALLVLGPA